ncbi:glycosyltransferase family 25 protein [Bathymodiolus septemdierum thioautotrophic gill symbiont]|nr:glycosyltransferase family 25 protein [Bathymodiolus septemdierum thioautotrophic gill symbiont]
MKKIKIFIMNPEKFQDRRKSLKNRLDKTKFEYEFMSINDEVDLTPDAIVKNHNSKKTIDSFGRDFTRGELASTLNHLLAYEKFIQSGNEIAVILEDDVAFDSKEFEVIVNSIIKIINTSKPQICQLTPVTSYLKNNAIEIGDKHKIASVIQSWGSQAYIINRPAAINIIKVNKKSWIIADDWERYNRYAGISLFGVIPPIAIASGVFDSNLEKDRSQSLRNHKTLKYVLSRWKHKINADMKKYFYYIPFRGYIRNR